MGRTGTSKAAKAKTAASPTLDLERYVPAFVTFIANKLSRSATALYQARFGVAHLPRHRLRQGTGEPHACGLAGARPDCHQD
jgi:hypothetical protein